MIVKMKKERCILCNGSGWVTPYPYRRRKKCDHKYSKSSLMFEVDRLTEEYEQIKSNLDRFIKAINTSEEIK